MTAIAGLVKQHRLTGLAKFLDAVLQSAATCAFASDERRRYVPWKRGRRGDEDSHV